jgi:hypothetical protein
MPIPVWERAHLIVTDGNGLPALRHAARVYSLLPPALLASDPPSDDYVKRAEPWSNQPIWGAMDRSYWPIVRWKSSSRIGICGHIRRQQRVLHELPLAREEARKVLVERGDGIISHGHRYMHEDWPCRGRALFERITAIRFRCFRFRSRGPQHDDDHKQRSQTAWRPSSP